MLLDVAFFAFGVLFVYVIFVCGKQAGRNEVREKELARREQALGMRS